jgi:Set1/Ash2 histone methyltransferase complex subunit ASH2
MSDPSNITIDDESSASLPVPSAAESSSNAKPPPRDLAEDTPAEQSHHRVLPKSTAGKSSAGRNSSNSVRTASPPMTTDAALQASLRQAVPLLLDKRYNALASLLTASDLFIPTVASVTTAALKVCGEKPPYVHWNKADTAAPLKIDDFVGVSTTQLRGYRMARASHGVSHGNYYYELYIAHANDTHNNLTSSTKAQGNSSSSRQQQQQQQQQRLLQQQQQNNHVLHNKRQKVSTTTTDSCSHVRLGFSMQSGDLQAPVGYDKWSFAIRSLNGAILHKSQRQDSWGGAPFGPGDVVGCAISLQTNDNEQDDQQQQQHHDNHIRFFVNGQCLGQFVIIKGKRQGGEAFVGIESGTYYPAVSLYMGGAVRANFGPHWICPPRKLPAGFKVQPFQTACAAPLSPDHAVLDADVVFKLFKKPEQQEAMKEAIRAEAQVLCDAYTKFMEKHVREVRAIRQERGLSVQDLPEPAIDASL